MSGWINALKKRFESLEFKIDGLTSLRELLGRSSAGIDDNQWLAVETELSRAKEQLLARLEKASAKVPRALAESRVRWQLNDRLGEIEQELSTTYSFFDTYMDVLSQRNTPELGPMLAGCDILALDALRKDHPTLQALSPPVVFCSRGFGASILRGGVSLPGRARNPLPLIQIPFSKLREKYNLGSVLHEVGHEALARLRLVSPLSVALQAALEAAGAPKSIQRVIGLWSSEIGPDFWTFCASGIGQTDSIREILAVPAQQAFYVNLNDPHPPPFLRILICMDWPRYAWGKGVWNNWHREWLLHYPPKGASRASWRMISRVRGFIPVITRALYCTRFRALQGRRLPDLFDFSVLSPSVLERTTRGARMGVVRLGRLTPCAQLAIFRLLRTQENLSASEIDRLMTRWLNALWARRRERVA